MIENMIFFGILIAVIVVYAKNNPMGHKRAFRVRCFFNWFPMGLMYAFLYMGRYNLTVSKNALGSLMSKEDFGIIFAAGTVTYALSFLINGPLVDKIGGKKGIIIGAAGSAIMNSLMGIVTWLVLAKGVKTNLRYTFSILYAINMYFQSYGAVSIVKLNSHWFHIRERGVFSGIFGTLISVGIYFAFDWGQSIVKATRATIQENLGFFESLLRKIVVHGSADIDRTWFVFFIPALILFTFVIIELFLLKDRPSQAGFEDFDTGDASSGEMDVKYTTVQILKKIITNPVIIAVGAIEFCSGVIRNGIMHWYFIYAKEANLGGATHFFKSHWGLLLCFAGISGGFIAGTISDKLFQSRRGPSAAFMYGGMVAGTIIMTAVLRNYPLILGITVVTISLCVIGVHGLLSGTATMDFGGRKGAATAVGIIDGLVYLGTAVQSISLGFITTRNWNFWPVFLIPFSCLGFGLAIKIWKAFPKARIKPDKG